MNVICSKREIEHDSYFKITLLMLLLIRGIWKKMDLRVMYSSLRNKVVQNIYQEVRKIYTIFTALVVSYRKGDKIEAGHAPPPLFV